MTIDPTKVSFSQAQGYEPLPRQLQLGDIPYNARMSFWNAFYLADRDSRSEDYMFVDDYEIDKDWRQVLMSVHADFFYEGLDTFIDDDEHIYDIYKPYFLDADFNKVFDLIVFFVRHPQCPNQFIGEVGLAFLKHPIAYVFDFKSRTIYPAATPEEGKAIVDAVHELHEHGFDGARNHLMQSASLINQGEWAQSVHQSISAVESVARRIAPGTNTLGDALNQLRSEGLLEHRALEQGLGNLYGYTSDEQGVRHSLLDQGQSNVGQDEAVFMLGACASFASYLWRKHLGASS